MSADSEMERFRVPVPADLAIAIERLAKRMKRPTAWLAVELLQEAVEERRSFADWIALTLMGKAYDVIRKVAGTRRQKSLGEEVRLELNVPVPLVDTVSRIAEQMNISPVKAAGMLLASAVHHNELFIELVTTKWVRAAMGKSSTGKSKRSVEPKETPLA